MMAAAMMHENGRLVQPAASKTWEYDSNANSSWSGPSNQPDGKVIDYDGKKSGFEASQDIAEQMRSGKLKPGDIVRVPADKSSSGQEIYLQHHGADFGDWPFLPVRKFKQLIKRSRTIRLNINSLAYKMLRIRDTIASFILFRSTPGTSYRKMNIRIQQVFKKMHKSIIHSPIALST